MSPVGKLGRVLSPDTLLILMDSLYRCTVDAHNSVLFLGREITFHMTLQFGCWVATLYQLMAMLDVKLIAGCLDQLMVMLITGCPQPWAPHLVPNLFVVSFTLHSGKVAHAWYDNSRTFVKADIQAGREEKKKEERRGLNNVQKQIFNNSD